MGTTLSGANKLLLFERLNPSYVSPTNIPEEYTSLIIPAAGAYFREDAEAEILSQNINFGPFTLWIHDIWAKENIVLCPFIPSHIWSLHGLYEESLHLESPDAPSYLLEEKEFNLFNLPAGLHRIPMAAGKKILSIHINVEQEVLKAMVEEFPGLEALTKLNRKEAGALNAYPYNSNPICDFLMEKMLSCKYPMKRAYPYIFRICIDLLRNIAAQEANLHQPLMVDSVLNTESTHQLLNYIREHPFRKNTVTQLAYMFDTSAKKLSFEFKQHFAVSIHDFMHTARMMMIYDMMQNQTASMDEIARISEFPNVMNMMMQVADYYACNRSATYQ
jgi:AraC-like DNA-binding protein